MEFMNISYKEFHEQYMTNLNGTSSIETFGVLVPCSISVLLASILVVRECHVPYNSFTNFLIEFIVIVVTTSLLFTLLADNIVHTCLILFVLCCFSVGCSIHKLGLDINFKNGLNHSLNSKRKPFITNFRALTSVLTAICILAVDFTIFPRRFAKTETFGFSLMDTGVGLFCMSNSIVISCQNNVKGKSFVAYFIKAVRSCLPLVFLGGIRFFTVKQIDYQMHVSEYGVHWNFFLTLAFSKLISSLILWFCNENFSHLAALIIITVHEIVLRKGVQDWVLGNIPRDTLVNANREGISSLFGYVALFMAGVAIRNFIFSKSYKTIDLILLHIKCVIMSIILWSITLYCSDFLNTSRRLANLGYFIWIITYSVSILVLLIPIDLFIIFFKFYLKIKEQDVKDSYTYQVPIIFESVNSNGLAFFLLANIFTGIINLSIQTLTVCETYSVLIINIYMFLVCGIMFALYVKDIKLKIW